MSRDKQIEELAKDLSEATRIAGQKIMEETKAFVKEYHRYHSTKDFDKAHGKNLHELEAEYLTAKGYRKTSDIAREIFEEIEKIKQDSHCEDCLGEWHEEGIFFGGIAELKKKYTNTEGGE